MIGNINKKRTQFYAKFFSILIHLNIMQSSKQKSYFTLIVIIFSCLWTFCLPLSNQITLKKMSSTPRISNSNVSLEWVQSFPAYQWGSWERASPAIGNINGDNQTEIIMNYGIMYAIDGKTGSILHEYGSYPNFYCSSPVITDLTKSNSTLIFTGTAGSQFYALNGDSLFLNWSEFNLNGGLQTTPAVGNVFNDGIPYIFTGSNYNFTACINGSNGQVVWSFPVGGNILSDPALGDVNKDNITEELYFAQNSPLYCLNAETGSLLWTYPMTGVNTYSSPIIGDVNNDGQNEVLINGESQGLLCINGTNGNLIWSHSNGGV